MSSFDGLTASRVPTDSPVSPAQRYLASAYDSVANLIIETFPALRSQRQGSRGRLTHAEQDVFRAAVVFAGAGIDTVLKEALPTCVPLRIAASEDAREKYANFVERYIQDGGEVSVSRLAGLLTAENLQTRLRDAYVDRLTGSSLQSNRQVQNSLSALGLSHEKQLYKEAGQLTSLFEARNQIAHEMDMTPSARKRTQGKRSRHERSMGTYKQLCHTGLDYCQKVLNALDAAIETTP